MELGYFDAAGHWLTYLLAIIGVVYVALFAVFTMRRAWKRAVAKGYSKEKLSAIVKGTISFTLFPSIGVVAGLFTIFSLLGLPLSWFRLSVIGATVYEIMAAQMSLAAAQIPSLDTATAKEFVLVMFVMAIGIMGGMLVSPVISKRIQNGTLSLKQKDRRWGALGNSVFMMVILVVFVVPMVLSGGTKLLTMFTGVVITLGLVLLIKKTDWKWLSDFVPVISMVLAMISSILWTNLFG